MPDVPPFDSSADNSPVDNSSAGSVGDRFSSVGDSSLDDANNQANAEGRRVGIWIFGGRGSVATTVQAGAAALAARLIEPIGVVTSRSEFADAPLISFAQMVFGGHDLSEVSLAKRLEHLVDGGVLAHHVSAAIVDDLERFDANIRVGVERGHETARIMVDRLRADIVAFREAHQLEQVIAVNLISVERESDDRLLSATRDEILDWKGDVPVALVYALAALDADAAFVDFTPSSALRTDAVLGLAKQKKLPVAGRDGKTGETLIKSTLAPMFARRNLRVRSWAGLNLLGGGDGAALADPQQASAKLNSKGRVLDETLGYSVEAPLHIDYVEALGEWKTAWDHIVFEGFLGAQMTLQFTWHGLDSSLAAPLVLDLIRLTSLAMDRNESGPLGPLGFFFKDPVGTGQHALDEQWRTLRSWVAANSTTP